ncbi:BPTI/Kunitz domain-containing protein-like [Scyliorhinus torazame]|uniref:BPTI/Kunitz domain-containing protein-like n=1 Tax=Scyliorhinus torazame TaxID=75743 RepID=UPI003B5AC4F2
MEFQLLSVICSILLLAQQFDIVQTDVRESCYLLPSPGSCRALMPRFFYNRSTETCEPFNYGGCGGNANRFLTLSDCGNRCNGVHLVPKLCNQPKIAGSCSQRILRYFHSQVTCRCAAFYYGGCGGNDNNFVTLQTCQRVCPTRS